MTERAAVPTALSPHQLEQLWAEHLKGEFETKDVPRDVRWSAARHPSPGGRQARRDDQQWQPATGRLHCQPPSRRSAGEVGGGSRWYTQPKWCIPDDAMAK